MESRHAHREGPSLEESGKKDGILTPSNSNAPPPRAPGGRVVLEGQQYGTTGQAKLGLLLAYANLQMNRIIEIPFPVT
jgi:hypothetical protein